MNGAYPLFSTWLADYMVAATILLAAVISVTLALKQPVHRIVLARAAAGGLITLALVGALPSWPRIGWPRVVDDARRAEARHATRASNVAGDGSLEVAESHNVAVHGAKHAQASNAVRRRLLEPTPRLDRSVSSEIDRPGAQAVPQPTNAYTRWFQALMAVFQVGAILSLLWLVMGAVQIARLRCSTRQASASLHALLKCVAGDTGQLPDLRLSSSIPQPAALGILRPTIILPQAFVDSEPTARLESVLAHELAHIRNGDLWLLGALRLLLPLLFAHPLYWWLRHYVRLDQELVADAMAARGDRLQYAQALLDWSRGPNSRLPVPCMTVALWERRSLLTRRIAMLVDHNYDVQASCLVWCRWVIQCATALGVLALSILTLRPMVLQAEEPQAVFRAESTTGFRGRVLDPDGNPVAGATVRVMILADHHNTREPRTVSGSDGRFVVVVPTVVYSRLIEHVDGETGRIIASAPGFGFGWAVPSADKEITVRLVNDSIPIEGRIIDADGQPVTGVTVKTHNLWVTSDDDLGQFVKEVKLWGCRPWQAPHKLELVTLDLAATTGADGSFRLQGIGRNRVAELVIASPAIASEELFAITREQTLLKSVSWVGVERSFCAYHGARFTHTAARTRPVVGTVRDRDSGQPLAGIKIRGEVGGDEGHTQPAVSTISDAEGHFQIAGLRLAQEYQILAQPGPGIPFVPAKRALSTKGLSTDPLNSEFALNRGVPVRGRLIEKVTGRPVRGLVSYLPFPDNPNAKVSEGIDFPARSNDDGRFEIVVLPGHGVIMARADEGDFLGEIGRESILDLQRIESLPSLARTIPHMPAYHVITEVNPASSTELLTQDLILESARTATGEVVDPDGRLLKDVIGYGINEHPWSHEIVESGKFTLSNLDPRTPRRVTFFHIERKLAGSVRVSGDERGPVIIRLQPWGTVTGRLVDSQGHPENGLVLSTWSRERNSDEGTFPRSMAVDAQGRFRFDGLVAGLRYSALVRGQEVLPDREAFRDVRVVPGETKDLGDVRLRLIPTKSD